MTFASALEWSGCSVGTAALNELLVASAMVQVTKGSGRDVGRCLPIGDVIADWISAFGATLAAIVIWPLDYRLAIALAKGAWFGDVSARFRRQCLVENTMALVGPSVGAMRASLSLDIGVKQTKNVSDSRSSEHFKLSQEFPTDLIRLF